MAAAGTDADQSGAAAGEDCQVEVSTRMKVVHRQLEELDRFREERLRAEETDDDNEKSLTNKDALLIETNPMERAEVLANEEAGKRDRMRREDSKKVLQQYIDMQVMAEIKRRKRLSEAGKSFGGSADLQSDSGDDSGQEFEPARGSSGRNDSEEDKQKESLNRREPLDEAASKAEIFYKTALETETVDDAALETGTVDEAALETGTVDEAVLETGTVDEAALETGTVDEAVLETGTVDEAVLETGTVDEAVLETETVDDAALETGTVDEAVLETGTVDDAALETGTVDEAVLETATIGVAVPEAETANETAPQAKNSSSTADDEANASHDAIKLNSSGDDKKCVGSREAGSQRSDYV
uniref:Helicase ARIP4 n=1 Tax=Macrostomum lignano TaxID=282301 RepID=A0A1I8ITJ2_9PLAT